MELISNDAAYFILLLFGAFAVGVNAFNLYGIQLDTGISHARYRLLDEVSLASLGGQKSYIAGFLCYLFISEFIFLVLSTSSVILELSLQAAGNAQTAGALTMDDGSLNPMFPILASSVMVTLTQIKPFSEIENVIRRISHHVAGIPDNVFDVLSRLSSFDFFHDTETSRTVAAARSQAELAYQSACSSEVDPSTAEQLRGAIVRISSLNAWSFGADGERIWSSQALRTLSEPYAALLPRLESFEARLKNLLRDTDQANEEVRPRYESDWRKLTADSLEVRNDLSSLFSLLYINQPDIDLDKRSGAMRELIEHVRGPRRRTEFNSLLGSIVIGAIANTALIYLFLVLTRFARNVGTAASTNGVSERVFSHMATSISPAVWEVLNLTLLYGVSAGIALSLRASRMAGLRWKPWKGPDYPFVSFLNVSLLATVFASLLYILFSFMHLVVYPSLVNTGYVISTSLLADFQLSSPALLFTSLSGIPCAWYACLMADCRAHTPVKERIQLAVLFALLLALLRAGVELNSLQIHNMGSLLHSIFIPLGVYLVFFLFYARVFERPS